MWDELINQITLTTGKPFRLESSTAVSGGSISQTYRLQGSGQCYFVKLNQPASGGLFEAEYLGLVALQNAAAIRVPSPLCWGMTERYSYLVMEWLDLRGSSQPVTWNRLGQALARLHQQCQHHQFGWQQQNVIGSTPQPNPWTDSWIDFFREHRLGYQFRLARRRGGNFPRQEQLLAALPQLLTHHPNPSLVHGDLWSGNAGITATGEPVIFDPAVYYGDREVDIAMTELFGGFPESFYAGYHQVWPLEPGYSQRKILYNLYHILNHFNLFGGGYAAQANRMIEQLLSK